LGIDITKIGTKKTIPTISFYAYRHGGISPSLSCKIFGIGCENETFLQLYSGNSMEDNEKWSKNITGDLKEDEWVRITLPIGPYYNITEGSNEKWNEFNTPVWTNIIKIAFRVSSGYILIDDLRIEGIVTRAAYHSGSIAAIGCKTKLITDSLAKCDTLLADDVSSPLAMFAYAELKRSMTTPLTGTIQIPLDPTLLAGQKLHIHASKTVSNFKIDGDMRILELKHCYTILGAFTYVTLTDDLINSYPIGPSDLYTAILKAVNPDFQNRDLGSLKAGAIDIEQTVLAHNYA
jgi:hypothetical protein